MRDFDVDLIKKKTIDSFKKEHNRYVKDFLLAATNGDEVTINEMLEKDRIKDNEAEILVLAFVFAAQFGYLHLARKIFKFIPIEYKYQSFTSAYYDYTYQRRHALQMALGGCMVTGQIEVAKMLLAYGANPYELFDGHWVIMQAVDPLFNFIESTSFARYALYTDNQIFMDLFNRARPHFFMIDHMPESHYWCYVWNDKDFIDCEYVDDAREADLIASVVAGRDDAVEILLKHGANPNTCIPSMHYKNRKTSVLMMAARFNYSEVVKLLLQYGADFSVYDDKGKTALDVAKDYCREAIIQKIIFSCNDYSFLSKDDLQLGLCLAARYKNPQKVEKLLEIGANLNEMTEFCSFYRTTPFIEAILSGDEKIVKILIDGGAEIYNLVHQNISDEEITLIERAKMFPKVWKVVKEAMMLPKQVEVLNKYNNFMFDADA